VLATPVPIRGGLLLRGEEHLFRTGPTTSAAYNDVKGK